MRQRVAFDRRARGVSVELVEQFAHFPDGAALHLLHHPLRLAYAGNLTASTVVSRTPGTWRASSAARAAMPSRSPSIRLTSVDFAPVCRVRVRRRSRAQREVDLQPVCSIWTWAARGQ